MQYQLYKQLCSKQWISFWKQYSLFISGIYSKSCSSCNSAFDFNVQHSPTLSEGRLVAPCYAHQEGIFCKVGNRAGLSPQKYYMELVAFIFKYIPPNCIKAFHWKKKNNIVGVLEEHGASTDWLANLYH